MMRKQFVEGLAVRRYAGRHQLVGDLAALLDVPLPEGCAIVGLGARGLTAAMTLAATRGADLAFVRSAQKDHGSGRVVDGAELGERPFVVVTHPDDAALVDLVPRRASLLLLLGEPGALASAAWPAGHEPPHTPRLSPLDQLEYLEGSYVTSSGRTVDRYVETLKASFRYDVALEFARRLEPTLAAADGHCAIAHGGALLSAVAAATQGQVADLFLVGSANGSVEFDRPTCFLDDFVGVGNAARAACLAVPPEHRSDSTFVAVFGPQSSVDFGLQTVQVLLSVDVGA